MNGESICLWCKAPYTLRHAGGSPRRFCSPACRLALHGAARKWAVAEVEAGRLPTSALKMPLEQRTRCKGWPSPFQTTTETAKAALAAT
jgi:hypothetical protein